MSKLRSLVALVALIVVGATEAWPQDIARQEMQSLDEQVQEIKSDVLSIAAELRQLEERLLFPSNTQVSVFVSLEEGAAFRLDALQLRINGELAAHYIYSYKELEALQKGGVQRIYTGNISTGDHALEVTATGKLQSGRDFAETASFSFTKGVEPKLVGLTVGGSGQSGALMSLGEW